MNPLGNNGFDWRRCVLPMVNAPIGLTPFDMRWSQNARRKPSTLSASPRRYSGFSISSMAPTLVNWSDFASGSAAAPMLRPGEPPSRTLPNAVVWTRRLATSPR
jgi:hypothetical protein